MLVAQACSRFTFGMRSSQTSFLNGAADGSQMIAEAQGGGLLALHKVVVKLQLLAQGDACTDPFGLASLGVADRFRKGEDLRSAGGWHKEDAVVVAQDQVFPTYGPISHRGALQCILRTDIKALRAGWDRSQAEDGEPNRSDVFRVPMQPPDHEAIQASSLSL